MCSSRHCGGCDLFVIALGSSIRHHPSSAVTPSHSISPSQDAPRGQLAQSGSELVLLKYCNDVQSLAFIPGVGVQALEPFTDVASPSGHGKHTILSVFLSSLYVSIAHSRHVLLLFSGAYLPFPQGIHSIEPLKLVVPAGQGLHVVVAGFVPIVPELQATNSVAQSVVRVLHI